MDKSEDTNGNLERIASALERIANALEDSAAWKVVIKDE
jgi:hypothetical protein